MSDTTQAWSQRPWILAALLALAAFLLYLIIDERVSVVDNEKWQAALAIFVSVSAVSCALALEKVRWQWVLWFSLAWGITLAFVVYTQDLTRPFESYSILSGLISVCIALPLFQTMRRYGAMMLPYQDLHTNAWSNVICWIVAWGYVGVSFGLALVLAQLFRLIGIDFIWQLLREEWFVWPFIGANLGAALGVLKENERIINSVQGLVMAVLSILAPLLCLSLVLFLIASLFTGLQLLWDSTQVATPILLSCAIGAIVLANAIVRNTESQESQNRIMRYSAAGLCASILPLALIALLSMLQRVEQYGLTPDRIWGILTVLIATIYGTIYLWILVKPGHSWMAKLRQNNIRIASLFCLVTLLLALPIVDFAKISVRSQLARIDDGRTSVDQIDFTAFAFDFGPAGREALRQMQTSNDPDIVAQAELALSLNNRWETDEKVRQQQHLVSIESKLVVFPEPVQLPDGIKQLLAQRYRVCTGQYCLLVWEEGENTAQLVESECDPYRQYNETVDEYYYCTPTVVSLVNVNNEWKENNHFGVYSPCSDKELEQKDQQQISDAITQGDIEVRTVERKQLYIGGKPVGRAY